MNHIGSSILLSFTSFNYNKLGVRIQQEKCSCPRNTLAFKFGAWAHVVLDTATAGSSSEFDSIGLPIYGYPCRIVSFDFVSSKSHALTKLINDIDANQLLRIPREGGGISTYPKKPQRSFSSPEGLPRTRNYYILLKLLLVINYSGII